MKVNKSFAIFSFVCSSIYHTQWIWTKRNISFVFCCCLHSTGKENDANELDEDFDLENFAKKKKKKKKPFNLEELENNLPSADGDEKKDDAVNDVAGDDGGNVENDYDFDLDFMKTKKKKKKKKELDELVAEKTEEQHQIQLDNGTIKFEIFILIFKCFSFFYVFHLNLTIISNMHRIWHIHFM